MKKFYVLLVVLAMVFVSSMALAADVTVGGTMQLRSRNFDTLTLDSKNHTGNQVDTQTRAQINVDAKAGDFKARMALWNDFNSWGGSSGGFERPLGTGFGNSGTDGSAFGFREAWIMTPIVDTGFTLKGGHQLLQLANGLFFRSQHFGSDAWLLSRQDGPNTLVLVDVKITEGRSVTVSTGPTTTGTATATSNADDADSYMIADIFKINETMTVGADLTMLNDRKNFLGLGNATEMQNLGVNFTGKAGPVNLKAEVDVQMGKAKGATSDPKFKGSMIYVGGDVPVDPASINFAVARGSGPKKGQTDYNQFVTLLDVDPHVAFLYEYKIAGACGLKNQGFCNTTAVNAGAKFNATKSLTLGANIWYLQATEKVANKKDPLGGDTSDLGTEFDVKISWKMSDNLAWNWDLGYFKPGNGMGKDDALGAMGILAYTF